MTLLLFLIGLVLVVVGSDYFVEASVRAAKRLKMSEMLIGATLVSLGTTLPELMVSTRAAFEGHAEMAIGNAIGSVICNTALVAGLVQAVRATVIEASAFRKNCLWFAFAAAVFCILAYTGDGISRIAGAALLACLVLYILSTLVRSAPDDEVSSSEGGRLLGDVLVMAVMALALFFGANLLVDNGARLAKTIGIPEHVISVSMIALGTSLPELLTAITALRKKHSALSLGNIIGANILNLFLVTGASGVIAPLKIAEQTLHVDVPVMLLVSLILLLPGFFRKKLFRSQGAALLAIYGVYIAYLYMFR